MKEIELKFDGKIYIESFGEQEEEDRIKVFDSDKEYLDYFSVESLAEMAEIYDGMRIQDMLDVYAAKMEEKEGVVELLDFLCINWYGIYPNKAALIKATGMDIHEVDNNEWINHIGEYYILIEEN